MSGFHFQHLIWSRNPVTYVAILGYFNPVMHPTCERACSGHKIQYGAWQGVEVIYYCCFFFILWNIFVVTNTRDDSKHQISYLYLKNGFICYIIICLAFWRTPPSFTRKYSIKNDRVYSFVRSEFRRQFADLGCAKPDLWGAARRVWNHLVRTRKVLKMPQCFC
jgi:hypothetical protein